MKIRKLVNFWTPNKWDNPQLYRIGYAYYIDGKWTGESEDANLSEKELYQLLKPKLQYNKSK